MSRWLARLLGAAAILALLGAAPLERRIAYDRMNVGVELVADLDGFLEVARSTGKDARALLDDLSARGVSAVAVRPTSAAAIAAAGQLRILPGARPGRTRIELSYPDPYSLASVCRALLPGTEVSGPELDVPAAGPLFLDAPLFLNHDLLRDIREAGLEPVHRLSNVSWLGLSTLKHIVDQLPSGGTIVFGDETVLGWPANLALVAEALETRDVRVGDVEFAAQEGLKTMLAARPLRHVRLHSIPPKELAKLPHSRLMPRWRRAVEERNIRVLYVHPIPEGQNPFGRRDLYEANLVYLDTLTGELRRLGFELGPPLDAGSLLGTETAERERRMARPAAALAAACLLAALLGMLELMPGWVLALVMLPVAGGLILSPKAAALVAAISAASLSSILFQLRTRGPVGATRIALELGLLAALNVLGGTLVFELLGDPAFVQHRDSFRGVKLVYLAPLALVCLDLIRRDRIPLLSTRLRVLDVALVGLLGAAGAVYLLRSGNFSPIPATHAEHSLRDRLEAALPVRPRTKEFLVGYPSLVLLAFLLAGRNWKARLVLLAGGTVASVSIANSFCHIHTPYLTTLARAGMGYLTGLLALLLLLPFRRAVELLGDAPYLSLSGYFGYGNCGDEWISRRQAAALRDAAGAGASVLVFARRRDPALETELGVRTASRWSPTQVLAGMALSRGHVSGGGGLFQDVSGPFAAPYYLAYPALARLFGLPYLGFVGQSYGSLRRRSLRRLLAWYASRADLVQPRDEASAETLISWGFQGWRPGPEESAEGLAAVRAAGRLEAGTDAFFWEDPALPPPRRESALLGVALRPSPRLDEAGARRLSEACRRLAKGRGLETRFLAFHPEMDRPLLERLAGPSEIVDVSPGNAAEVLSSLRALVAMRLHAMLAAAVAGVPLVAITYDAKTDAFLDAAGHAERLGPACESGELEAMLARLLDGPAGSVGRLQEWSRRELERGAEARRRFVTSVRAAIG